MSDAMKAIRNLRDRAIGHQADGVWDQHDVDSLVTCDHIGELHSAIARLQGEYKTGSMLITEAAFEDLFTLLPTDWAGETE